MKRLTLLLALFTSYSVTANAVETNITILGVRFNNSNAPRAQVLMDRVATSWPTSTGTTITLANGGSPLYVPTTLSGSTEVEKMDSAKLIAYGLNLRNVHAADVIFFFTDAMVAQDNPNQGICGWAPQDNWTASGGTPPVFDDPDSDGIDLAGSEHSYAAIMDSSAACSSNLTLSLHEFGHLFGGGHEDTGGHDYLYPDSFAYLIWNPWPYEFYIRSNLHRSYWVGENWWQYSDYAGVADNMRALNRTALSVANYRALYDLPPSPPPYPPPPPSGCSLSTPAYITQTLIAHCDPPTYSHYFLTWGDSCPSQTSYYQLWVEQPVGTGYLPDSTTSVPYTHAWVSGASGRVRVQACNGGGCSALSPDNVLLVPGC